MTSETKTLILVGLATLIILIGGSWLFSKNGSPNSPDNKKANSQVLNREESNKIATDSAKITIVEFGDYQCPACANVQPTVEKILTGYQDKINFVFRHFPLPQHQFAQISAQVAESAGRQQKYWEMHHLLYNNQSEWTQSKKPMQFFLKYAEEIGLDNKLFTKDVEDNSIKNKIQQDTADAYKLKINSTPTFFINDQKLTVAPTYENFKQKIEELL